MYQVLRRYDLFEEYFINKELENFQIPNIEEKMKILQNWNNNIHRYQEGGEKQLQSLFFHNIFEKLLDYKNMSTDEDSWEIEYEKSTEIDSSIPDAILGLYSSNKRKTKVVVELKGIDVIDLDKKQKRANKNYGSPVDQGYSYVHKYDGCQWIIVSNMLEIRLYKNGQSQHYYEQFFIPELAENKKLFSKFYLLFRKESLVRQNKIIELNRESVQKKLEITKSFYDFYSQARKKLWDSLRNNNPHFDEEELLEKAQKILNRITFILFSEANGLLLKGTLERFYYEGKDVEIISTWKFLHTLFDYINKGNLKLDINEFNGGLFKKDRILDSIDIPDEDFEIIEGFFEYNFKEGLTVDVLGHIFEQSISDIEELKGTPTKIGDRKENGIFYTPEYVTRYIVQETIEKWIEDKKEEIGFSSLIDWRDIKDKGWQTRRIQERIDLLTKLKNELSNIKILDPTCGSGAFLTKVFEYLYLKHNEIFKEVAELEALKKGQTTTSSVEYFLDMDRDILINNIFGIDLNKESVEITKLALWLQTANKNKPLTTLDENIIVGNTVIEDEELASTRRINWDVSFSDVKAKGGFDIILGNPPYIPIDILEDDTIKYYQSEYREILKNKWETSIIFMYKSSELLNENGILSMIVPVTWLTGTNYSNFRKEFFTKRVELEKLIVMPSNVFEDAYVDTCIFVAQNKKHQSNTTKYLGYKYPMKEKLSSISISENVMDEILLEKIFEHNTNKIFPNISTYKLYDRIKGFFEDEENFSKLGEITISTQGPVESQYKYTNIKQSETHFPYLKTGQGYRYYLDIQEKNYIDFSSKPTMFKFYTSTPRLYARRIVNRQDRIMFSYCNEDLVVKKELNPFVVVDDRFEIKSLYAILNSKLMSYIYINFSSAALKDDYRQTTLTDLRELPIKILNAEEKATLNEYVTTLENNLSEFHKKRNFALALIQSNLNGKINSKLKSFYDLTNADYFKEVKRADKKLTHEKIQELNEIYINYANSLKTLREVIYEVDEMIEKYVYSLYSLTKEEQLRIDEYYDQFNNPSSLPLDL